MAKTYSYNFTIDDSSPYIKYEPEKEWFDNVAGDADLANYFQSSYHFTATRGASASLNFVGTGITVVGSKYMTHDAIEVRIDNQIIRGFNAFSSTHQYRTFLAQVRNLKFGNHTIKVINRGSSSSSTSVLDIDAFVVETRGRGDMYSMNSASVASGNKTVDLPVLLVDDAKAAAGNNKITWSDGWFDDSTSLPNTGFLNGTVHETTKKGSTVTFDFYGEGIQVIGGLGPNNTDYTVQLDTDPIVTLNGKASDFIPSSTLFYKTNLSGGAHKIVVTNTGAEGSALTIDAFQIFGGTNKTDFTGQVATSNFDTNQRNLGQTGMIIGIVVGVIAFIIFLLIGLIVLAKHKGYELPFAVPLPAFLDKDDDNGRNRRGGDNGSIGAAPSWGLNRSNTRGSNRTFVDPELGGIQRTDNGEDKEGKKLGYGIGTMTETASKWITGLRDLVVRNPDSNNPVTPALPVQRPVINIGHPNGNNVSPGMVTVGLETGNGNNNNNNAPDATRVWMDGNRRIEDQHRFSDQSLNDDWDHRRTRYGVGAPANNNRGGGGRQGHSRNASSPTDNSRNPYTRNPHRNSTGTTYSVSGYGGQGSPGATEYPETPARPRYEIEQREYPSSTTINNNRANFGGRNGIGHGNTQAGGANRGNAGGYGFR